MKLRTALLSLITVFGISISHAETYDVKESEYYVKPVKVNTQEQFDTIYRLLDEHQATLRSLIRLYFETNPQLVGSIEYEKIICADLAFKLAKYEFAVSNYEFVGEDDDNYDSKVFFDAFKKPEYKKCSVDVISPIF